MSRPLELSKNTYVKQSVVLADTRECQVRVGADVPSIIGKTVRTLLFFPSIIGKKKPGSHRQKMLCCSPS